MRTAAASGADSWLPNSLEFIIDIDVTFGSAGYSNFQLSQSMLWVIGKGRSAGRNGQTGHRICAMHESGVVRWSIAASHTETWPAASGGNRVPLPLPPVLTSMSNPREELHMKGEPVQLNCAPFSLKALMSPKGPQPLNLLTLQYLSGTLLFH